MSVPFGETDAAQPSSLSCCGLPPNIENSQSPSLLAEDGHEASKCVLSGNHAKWVAEAICETSGCTSPVERRRR